MTATAIKRIRVFVVFCLLIIEALDIFNDSNCGTQQFIPHHSYQLPVANNLEALPNFATCVKVAFGLSKPRHAMWRNIVYKLSGKKGSLRILAVGGSETAGVFCSEPYSQDKTCAWPSRFVSWLRVQFPAIPIYLDNQATGGTSTMGSLPLITHWPLSDLILVDYIVNDAFDTAGSIIPAYESFIRQLSKSRPGVPVIFIITCPLEICSKVRDVIMWATSLYDIPVISFYDVAHCAAHIASQKNVTDIYWRGLHHPDWVTHQYIADTISYVFFHNTVCHTESHIQLTAQAELDKLQVCSPPSTSYSAHDIHKTAAPKDKDKDIDSYDHPGIVLSNWKLREDRKGKPGWITNSADSSISFPMQFGEHPRLVVSYLKSYKGLGKVRMTLNNR